MKEMKILVVDDELRIRKLLCDYLKRANYIPIEASDGEEALYLWTKDNYQAILLDVMMPKKDGWEVCKEIRKTSQVPILMLTAKTDEMDELRGFECGVDDYIQKPFSPRVVLARLELILKKHQCETEIIELGGIRLNISSHICTVINENNEEISLELSFKEFELLTYFMQHPRLALSRECLLNDVWNYDYFGDARTIDTHIKTLRSKLKDVGKDSYIKTIWGMGYKFEIPNETTSSHFTFTNGEKNILKKEE